MVGHVTLGVSLPRPKLGSVSCAKTPKQPERMFAMFLVISCLSIVAVTYISLTNTRPEYIRATCTWNRTPPSPKNAPEKMRYVAIVYARTKVGARLPKYYSEGKTAKLSPGSGRSDGGTGAPHPLFVFLVSRMFQSTVFHLYVIETHSIRTSEGKCGTPAEKNASAPPAEGRDSKLPHAKAELEKLQYPTTPRKAARSSGPPQARSTYVQL